MRILRSKGYPVTLGNNHPLVVIAGPCTLESTDLSIRVAETMAEICEREGVGYIFKGSFDKANRTSGESPRGPGFWEGLEILEKVRMTIGVPVTSDVHATFQAHNGGGVIDVMQIPALLSRQTDLIEAAAQSRCQAVSVKKGQFAAPGDAKHMLAKCGDKPAFIIERGTTFGYHNVVVDMRALQWMREEGLTVVFDASHTVQSPSYNGATSGGDRRLTPGLARAAVAAGVAGVFVECHPDPDHALSDGQSSMHLEDMPDLIKQLVQIDSAVKPWLM